MSYTGVAALLKHKMGLEADSIGAPAIERAVRERLTASGIADAQLYLEHVSASEIELQALIESVVVPETWFLRDRAAFAALARFANEHRLRGDDGVLRVLSLPCSTGEEPYSIAMTLLDAGVPAERFQIDAIDISTRAIAHAQNGVYGKNSFRGEGLEFRDRYFDPVARGHRLRDPVRAAVRFRHGNVFDIDKTVMAATYDVIFCRNLLIYFDRPEQDRAVRILGRLLDDRGLLFAGPSESGLFLDHGFVSTRVPLAFSFRKPSSGTPAAQEPQRRAPAKPRVSTLALVPLKIEPPKRPPQIVPPPVVPTKAPENLAARHWIDDARRMADAGDLTGALRYCEERANTEAPSAQTFYLMGLLHDAGGQLQRASECYRKALYLDPAHHEALVHLAMLLEGTGDVRGAQLLMARASRTRAARGSAHE